MQLLPFLPRVFATAFLLVLCVTGSLSQSVSGASAQGAAAELSEDELAAYVGIYELAPGFSITIRVEGTQIEAKATGRAAFLLQYGGEDRFNAPAFGIEIGFKRNKTGEVESLILRQGGQTLSGKRKTDDDAAA